MLDGGSVVVVEGIADALRLWTLGYPAVACFGSNLSDVQADKLVELADQVIALDSINPQVAARMVSAFNRWNRYDDQRKGLMKRELERIAAIAGLSPDTGEIVNSALK